MPQELSLLTQLKRFLAPENSLKGGLDFFAVNTLEQIAVPDNDLTGTFPTLFFEMNPNLKLLDLGGNQFTGSIPSSVAGATKLSGLQLDNNQLTGTIPSEIASMTLLKNLGLASNQLEGSVPEEIFGLNGLTSLSVGENERIDGTISTLIAQLTDLNSLQLGFTGLGGTLPEVMFALTKLSLLNLEGASFSGTIPETISLLNASLMDLFLNDNEFTGSVPVAFDYLTALGESRLTMKVNETPLCTKSISPRLLVNRNSSNSRQSTNRKYLCRCLQPAWTTIPATSHLDYGLHCSL
jgi:Leucine-rich repeat (LRR) protein